MHIPCTFPVTWYVNRQFAISLFTIFQDSKTISKTVCILRVSCSVESTLCDPTGCSPPGSCPWDLLGKNTGVGCHFLLQGIFLTQGLKACLLHCRWVLYHWATWEAQVFFCSFPLSFCIMLWASLNICCSSSFLLLHRYYENISIHSVFIGLFRSFPRFSNTISAATNTVARDPLCTCTRNFFWLNEYTEKWTCSPSSGIEGNISLQLERLC